MSHCLKRGSQHHSRLFQLIDGLPVCGRWAGLHEKKWLILNAPHQIMLHTCVNGSEKFLFLMPAWIVVPGYHIQNIAELLVIKTVVIIHQIGCYRQFRTTFTDCSNLSFDEINGAICNEPVPVKLQCMKLVLPLWGRGFNLIEAIVNMAPECGAPTGIQLLNGSIFFFQPFPEFLLTKRAIAFSAKLIGNVPQNHTRMTAQSLGKQLVHIVNFLPIYRRCIAMIMSASEKSSGAVRIHAKDLRILVGHPLWPCA